MSNLPDPATDKEYAIALLRGGDISYEQLETLYEDDTAFLSRARAEVGDTPSTPTNDDTELPGLRELAQELGQWSDENFGDVPSEWTLLGVTEELGELCHSELKQMQGIRLDDHDVGEEATKDAVGDITLFLVDFCNRNGYDFAECVEMAADEVLEREW